MSMEVLLLLVSSVRCDRLEGFLPCSGMEQQPELRCRQSGHDSRRLDRVQHPKAAAGERRSQFSALIIVRVSLALCVLPVAT
jgi:hypothetical protein